MTTAVRRPTRPAATRQQGFALIVAMLMLVVLTVLSLGMFRSFGLQERIAGNTREKERALSAAQSALQFGEWWLKQGGNPGTGIACTNKLINANVKGAMEVCSNALAEPATLPWTSRADYLPPAMTVQAGGGLAANGDINYHAKPGVYINYLGLAPDAKSIVYRVSAFGYGGTETTAAVVESTYQITSAYRPLDTP